MASDRTRRRTWTVGACVTALLVVFYLSGGVVSGLRSSANFVTAPFSWTVNEIARPIGHMFAGAVNYSDVVNQNQKLRYELGKAQLKANEESALNRQLTEMSTQLRVPFVGSLSLVSAQVTGLSPTNFAATVSIDRGRDSGVLTGMPVVANGGLVGSVISTTPHGATVRLISDVNSLIGVTFGNGKNQLVISGQGVNNGLGASSVALTTAIQPGTVLSTSGLNGALFPPGMPVAKVAKVSLTPGAATYDLSLEPTADLRNIVYLDVVLWEPST
ncbi:MAG TPA: rod shape-determining protein MreC [Acidimicrobiales bacterium]